MKQLISLTASLGRYAHHGLSKHGLSKHSLLCFSFSSSSQVPLDPPYWPWKQPQFPSSHTNSLLWVKRKVSSYKTNLKMEVHMQERVPGTWHSPLIMPLQKTQETSNDMYGVSLGDQVMGWGNKRWLRRNTVAGWIWPCSSFSTPEILSPFHFTSSWFWQGLFTRDTALAWLPVHIQMGKKHSKKIGRALLHLLCIQRRWNANTFCKYRCFLGYS